MIDLKTRVSLNQNVHKKCDDSSNISPNMDNKSIDCINSIDIIDDQNDDHLIIKTANPSNISLAALLSDKIGFQLFMKHMVKEYSSEHLLFLVELLQIKYQYQLQHNNQLKIPFIRTINEDENTSSILPLIGYDSFDCSKDLDSNDIAPKISKNKQYAMINIEEEEENNNNNTNNNCIYSYFFKSDGDICGALKIPFPEMMECDIISKYGTIYEQMKGLYLKYIESGTDLEIGIDYDEHQRLDKIFKTNDDNLIENEEYFTIFDSTAIQIIRLIRGGSFYRFKYSQLFEIFIQCTNIDLSDTENLKSNLKDPQIHFIDL